MGNQIKFTPKKKDEAFSVSEEDFQTMEIENIQLKNTNRKLISKLDKQKELIKNLAAELKTIRDNPQNKKFDELQKDYEQLKSKHENLKTELKKSSEEIARLKKNLNKKSIEKSPKNITENAGDSKKTADNSKKNSDGSKTNKETSEISTTTSHWDRLKSRLPDDIKNLRDSKKES